MNIFTSLFSHLLKNPPCIEHTVARGKLSRMKIQESSGPETFSKGKHIYKNTHQRSYLKLWIRKTLHIFKLM